MFSNGLAAAMTQQSGPVEGRPVDGDASRAPSAEKARWGSLPAPAFSASDVDRRGDCLFTCLLVNTPKRLICVMSYRATGSSTVVTT